MNISTNMHTESVRLAEYTEYEVITNKDRVEIFHTEFYYFYSYLFSIEHTSDNFYHTFQLYLIQLNFIQIALNHDNICLRALYIIL